MNTAQLAVLALVLSLWGCATNEPKTVPVNEQVPDTWVKTKILTTYSLNEYLNYYDINVDVQDGVATLTGIVENDIDRDLAEELAKGVEGVRDVNNRIIVNPLAQRDTARGRFMRYVDDTNITAQVKSRLLMNPNTQGTKIRVTTRNGVVLLKGVVTSGAEASLVRQIALNTRGVTDVESDLTVER